MRFLVCDTDAIVYNELLAQETFRKILLFANGTWSSTTAPLSLVFFGEGAWKWSRLKDDVCVACFCECDAVNEWWARNIASERIDHQFGDLCVFRWSRGLDWEDSDTTAAQILSLLT